MKNKEMLEFIKVEQKNILCPDFKVGIGQRGYIVIEKKHTTDKLITEMGTFITQENVVEYFYCLITILEIETILTPLMQKHGMFGDNENSLMLTSSLNKLDPELYKRTLNPTYPKKIETEQDVLDLLHDLKQYTENVAGPFFEKWSDLRVLDKFLDTVPQMDVHKYLSGYGGFSKLLVYKLCNNPKYDEYFNFIYSFNINRYKENPNGDIAIKQKHDFIIDFKEVLDRTEPIYNL